MKNPWILSVAAIGLSLVAIVTLLARTSSAPDAAKGSSVAPTASRPDAELLARLDALVEESRALSERLASLELRPAAPERTAAVPAFATREELDALREELRAALVGSGAALAEAPVRSPEFKEQVATTLSEIRKDEAVQKARAGMETRAARLDEAMPKYAEWLELSTAQTSALRVALEARYEREAELVRLWSEGGDDERLGELKASDRQTFVTDLSAFLTADQLETYLSRRDGK